MSLLRSRAFAMSADFSSALPFDANEPGDAPWVWFDADDVLVDSTPLFQESLDRWSGTVVPWQTWTHNRFHLFYGVKSEDEEKIRELREVWIKDRVLERSPLAPEAKAVMDEIRSMGANIGIITARAWHPEGREITEQMARDQRLPVSRVIAMHFEGTKAELLQKTGTRVAGFLDDTPRHVEACLSAGFNAALLSQPWNQDAQNMPRLRSLDEFPDFVRRSLSLSADETLGADAARRPKPKARF